MRKGYYTANAANLYSMRPAFGQIAPDVLKKLRNCVVKRLLNCRVRFGLTIRETSSSFTTRRETAC